MWFPSVVPLGADPHRLKEPCNLMKEPDMGISASDVVPLTQARATVSDPDNQINHLLLIDDARRGLADISAGRTQDADAAIARLQLMRANARGGRLRMSVFDEPKIDAHCHIFDPARFPYEPDVAYRPSGQAAATGSAAPRWCATTPPGTTCFVCARRV
jgi:hypothetical protein